MKIALVHDWLTGMRGGEKCLLALCQLFPQAEIFTLVHKRGKLDPEIESKTIHTSLVQRLPGASSHYQKYLPLFPLAIEQFDLSRFDLVISSSHCVAKGVLTSPQTCHISYCHTPMRYVWEMNPAYFNRKRQSAALLFLIKPVLSYLRSWDQSSSSRVDHFVANSRNVQNRIRKHYRRESEVIYPPVEVDFFDLSKKPDDYYLMVSALVPYKKIEIAIRAFNQLGKRLLIVGQGVEEKTLKQIAKSNIEFLPWQKPEELKKYYAGCKALVFPGEEDFGIVPVEAQASGKPVIAFGKGGVLESVQGGFADEPGTSGKELTGVFFREQSPQSLSEAVNAFERLEFDPAFIRKNALRFRTEIFKEKMKSFVDEKFSSHQRGQRI